MKQSYFILASMLNIYLMIPLPAAQMKIAAQQIAFQEDWQAFDKLIEGLHQTANPLLKMQTLLQQHPNIINLQDTTGSTVLMYASKFGHTEVAQGLIKYGANLNLQNKNGWTALMLAAKNGHTRIAQALIAHDANPNLQDTNGWTALMSTVLHGLRKGQPEVAQALIAAGADLNLQNIKGQTALKIARQWKCGIPMERIIKNGLAERQYRLEARQKVKQAILDNTDLAQDPVSLVAEYVGTRENIDSHLIHSSIGNNDDNTQPRKCIIM